MIASHFVDVGYPDISIQEVDGSDLLGLDKVYDRPQTRLYYWDYKLQGYINYGWFNQTDGDYAEDPSLNSKWVDTLTLSKAATELFIPGEGFWIETPLSGDPTTVLIAGEVVTSNTFNVVVKPGLNLISNPFPTKINIQNIDGVNLLGLDRTYDRAQTLINIWDYDRYGYVNYGWFNSTDGDYAEDSSLNSKWVDTLTLSKAGTIDIEVGASFWVILPTSAQSATITFNCPNLY